MASLKDKDLSCHNLRYPLTSQVMNYQGNGKKRRWTKREDRMVRAKRRPDAELSVMINRSVSSIYQRRFALMRELE